MKTPRQANIDFVVAQPPNRRSTVKKAEVDSLKSVSEK